MPAIITAQHSHVSSLCTGDLLCFVRFPVITILSFEAIPSYKIIREISIGWQFSAKIPEKIPQSKRFLSSCSSSGAVSPADDRGYALCCGLCGIDEGRIGKSAAG
jgi:hypothetical protein